MITPRPAWYQSLRMAMKKKTRLKINDTEIMPLCVPLLFMIIFVKACKVRCEEVIK